MTKEEFEFKAQSLVGERIERVRYFEIDYKSDQEVWNDHSDFDSLDYGVDFEMRSGVIKGIIWGSEFCQYGISIISGSIATELKESREIDVSSKRRWQGIIGSKIENVEVQWSWAKGDGIFKKKTYYPQDLVLTFSDNKMVYISALEIGENTYFGMADNITIFFNENIARKYLDIKVEQVDSNVIF